MTLTANDPGQRRNSPCDVILAGGGLASALLALRLQAKQPDVNFVVIERGPTLGGNHTWSFHDSDVDPDILAWLKPLVSARWASQEVRFPAHTRVLHTAYNSIASHDLHRIVAAALGDRLMLNQEIGEVRGDRVVLADGREITAPCVIDARGAVPSTAMALGYQKFVGIEVELEQPHGLERPVIMDATVEQRDGYRFVYTLPFSPTRLLIEDTYYSDTPDLDPPALLQACRDYATAKGWRIASVVRQEKGVLPITLAGDIDKLWSQFGSDIPRIGLRAWIFHPTTGYSLPYAADLADRIAGLPQFASREVAGTVERRARQIWSEQSFMRMLNRLLFIGARPGERFRVLERFYRLPEPLIQRLYGGRLTRLDYMRILIGKPPISVARAIGALGPQAAWTAVHANRPNA